MGLLMKEWFFLALLMLNTFCSPLFAANAQFFNEWISLFVHGHFKKHEAYFWQAESQFRLNMGDPLLSQNLERFRLGKELNAHSNALLGYDFIPTRLAKELVLEQRFIQQIMFKSFLKPHLSFKMFNRLEERWVDNYSGISLRDRIKFQLFYCPEEARTCPRLFSETFINLNHTQWDPSNTLSQQRTYAGMEIKLSHDTHLNLGYINQYTWSSIRHVRLDIADIQLVHNFK